MLTKLRQCNRFDTCSANLCPLYQLQRQDGSWIQQVKGEPTCQYCRAVAKNAVETIPENIRDDVVKMFPIMMENCGTSFRSEMTKAAKTPVKSGFNSFKINNTTKN